MILKKIALTNIIFYMFFFSSCHEKVEIGLLERDVIAYEEFDDDFQRYVTKVFESYLKMVYYADTSFSESIYVFNEDIKVNYNFETHGGLWPAKESFEWRGKVYYRKIKSIPIMSSPYFICGDNFYALVDPTYSLRNIDSLTSFRFYRINLKTY